MSVTNTTKNQIQKLKVEFDALKKGKDSLLTILDEAEIPENVYNSNAIENSTLTLKETEKILLEMELSRDVSLWEVFEAKNLARVIEYTRGKVNDSLIKDFQSLESPQKSYEQKNPIRIFITTGTYTDEAKKQAANRKYPQVITIDGKALVELATKSNKVPGIHWFPKEELEEKVKDLRSLIINDDFDAAKVKEKSEALGKQMQEITTKLYQAQAQEAQAAESDSKKDEEKKDDVQEGEVVEE